MRFGATGTILRCHAATRRAWSLDIIQSVGLPKLNSSSATRAQAKANSGELVAVIRATHPLLSRSIFVCARAKDEGMLASCFAFGLCSCSSP